MTHFRTIAVFALVAILSQSAWGVENSDVERVASQLSHQISTQEWLGPIAAISLSPFFGLTCLSGLATYGPEALRSHSSLLATGGPMNNPTLFWIMLGLTTLTSIPRFTKISKPIGLLAEKLEAYSAIVILVVMRFASSGFATADIESITYQSPILVAGIGNISVDLLMSLAAAVNLIVINTVKLAIEFVIWLVPVPMIDSLFEIINKSMCAALAVLYAYSPTLSLAVNLVLFAICAFVFVQVARYLRYFQGLFIWPIFRSFLGIDESAQPKFPAFLKSRWNRLPAYSELVLYRREGDRFEVFYDTWMSSHALGMASWSPADPGFLVDRLFLKVGEETVLVEVRKGTVSIPIPAAGSPTA